MKQFFKQLFCWHDWELTFLNGDHAGETRVYTCHKCQAEEITTRNL